MPRNCNKKDEGPFWYNEVPPLVFFNAAVLKEGRAQIFNQKWQREILDQDLDLNQRQMLRDERTARVYLNPPPIQIKPKKLEESVTQKEELKTFSEVERLQAETLGTRHLAKAVAIYGLDLEELAGRKKTKKKASGVLNAKGEICTQMRRLPPYTGPHALHLTPWDVAQAKPKRSRYQVKVFGDKVEGHELLQKDSKDVKQYSTTPLAVWRRHRFTSPYGSQFKDIKEQIKAAKHKAMLALQEKKKPDEVLVGHAKLTSHFKPWTGKVDSDLDLEDLQQDRALAAKAREDMELSLAQMRAQRRDLSGKIEKARLMQQGRKGLNDGVGTASVNTSVFGDTYSETPSNGRKTRDPREIGRDRPAPEVESGENDMLEKMSNGEETVETGAPLFTTKLPFSVEERFLEDLEKADIESKKELAPLFTLQPIGNFYPDPRKDPQFNVCYKKEKALWTMKKTQRKNS